MMEPNFWDDHNSSQNYVQQLNQLRKVVETFKDLKERFTFVEEGLMLLKEEMDQEFYDSMLQEIKELQKEFDAFSILVLLNKDYDQKNAIIEIHPGAGGTESQDFAEMLYRMYTRWAQSNKYKVEVLDYLDGDEAGIKSVRSE